ncbi:MAG: cation:proton antiporter, partial [Myxococcota bacterium]|nr:cation:proton antiporter [Myxococcota bacterium]
SSPLATLGKQFGIAIVVGAVGAWCWMPIMRLLRGSPHAYPVTLSALIVLYVSVEAMGGSAALGILAFAIVVGNARAIVAKVGFLSDSPVDLGDSVRDVHSNIAFIIKSLFFCFIGLMIGPPWGMVAAGVLLGLMLLAVRVPAVWVATRGAGLDARQLKIVTVSLPRGMAAGVLATIPHAAGVGETENLPPLVFAAVVTTILVFAVGFPLVSRGAGAPADKTPDPEQTVTADPPPPFEPRPPGISTEPLIPKIEGAEGQTEPTEGERETSETDAQAAEPEIVAPEEEPEPSEADATPSESTDAPPLEEPEREP